jgi:Lamin Tail Domain/Secretion system C-terminal sorting domain
MKKLILSLIIILAIAHNSNAQVVINEILPDPGNYEGQGAEWTELYNTSATPLDLSCWVLTDGDEIVVFPSGTYIPANGYLVVYNGNFFNCTSCNWDPAIANLVDNVGTLASPDPDGVTSVNVATCGCTNQTGCFSVTWENPITDNGTDRIVLFDANANIKDAIYYGIGDNYAAASSPILESVYAIGPNTLNHNITGLAAGCNLPAANNYDIPALPAAGTSNAVWKYAGGTINGCTTSKARSTNGGATFIDDLWPTPGGNNTNADYKVTYTINAGAPIDITNTDNITLNICSGVTIAFNGEVYDYNQVYNNNAGDAGNVEGGSARGGSHIIATGGLVFDDAWTEAVVSATGLTALNYPATAPITANTTFKIYIKENTQGAGNINANTTCPAAGAFIQGQGSANECYVAKTITVNIVSPITAASFTCANGLVKVTTTPALTTGLTYNLVNSVTPALNQTNTNGQFQITSGVPANFSINVVQTPACAAPITATGTVCVFAPPCPTLALNTATSTVSGAKCPGDVATLCVDLATSTNLPIGGSVEWYKGATSTFDPYVTGNLLTSVPITPASVIPTNTTPVVSEVMYRPATGDGTNPTGEWIELAAAPGTSIGCMIVTDGDFAITIPSGTVMPASGFYTIGNGGNGTTNGTNQGSPSAFFAPNLNTATCGCSSAATVALILTNAGEFVGLYNNTGTFVDGVIFGTPSAANTPGGTANITVIAQAGCTLPATISPVAGSAWLTSPGAAVVGQSIERNGNGTGTWQLTDNASLATAGAANTPPVGTVTCYNYTIPVSECNNGGNLFIKGIVKPIDAACVKANATTVSRQFTVSCPTATISGQKAICSGASTSFDVVLANFGTNTNATIAYSINGVAQTPVVVPIVVNIVTIPNITTAGIVTITAATFSGGAAVCNASVSGDVTINVNANPTTPTSAPVAVCAGKTTAVAASGGGPSYNWYSDISLTTLVATGNPYYYTGPTTTLYVQSIDPDNGCVSTGTSVAVTATTPPSIVTPASINCATGDFLQTATGGTGTLTYTLAGKTGATGNPIGTSNTTGTFNLFNCTGATILVEDGSGCFDIFTYNFTVAPYNCSGVVALQFEKFSAQKRNQTTVLNWTIYDDVNIDNYIIERSTDGLTFKKIGTIDSKKLNIASYIFTDNSPANNKNYYRIKAVSNNGADKFTDIRFVTFTGNFDISITPNPTKSNIEIVTNNNDKKEITIIDTKGSIYYHQINNLETIKVNCNTWANGIYFVKVKYVSFGTVVNKKIIKQ